MRSVHTDLAMESSGLSMGMVPGVHVTRQSDQGIEITEVVIDSLRGAEVMGKAQGTYITMECAGCRKHDLDSRAAVARKLAEALRGVLPEDDGRPVLIIGLGNRAVTPDSLGPLTVDGTLVTRHVKTELPEHIDERMGSVCAMAPGVLGVTGVETVEVVRGVVDAVKPRAVIAIDSLAAKSAMRICATVQLATSGIQPGSGVGNHRKALTDETLGVPVLAIGIPMVVYAATIVRDALEMLSGETGDDHERAMDQMAQELLATDLGEMIVTPREVDDLVAEAAQMIARGINYALHPRMPEDELEMMMD